MTDHGQVFMNLSFYIESSSPKPSRTSFATAFLLYHASNTRYTYSRVISGGAMTNMKEKGSRPLSFHSSDLPAYSLPIPRSTHSSAKVTDRERCTYSLANSFICLQSPKLEFLRVELAHDAHARRGLSRAHAIRMQAFMSFKPSALKHDNVSRHDIRQTRMHLRGRLRIHQETILAGSLCCRRIRHLRERLRDEPFIRPITHELMLRPL